jgi:hypothetical protein
VENPWYLDECRPKLSQGDIFKNVLFANWVMNADGKSENNSSGRHLGMLLTFDCEIDKKECFYLLFAKIIPVHNLPDNARGNVRKNKPFSTFYLPENGDFPESFVDLRQMERCVRSQYSDTDDRILSLTKQRREHLRDDLAKFFGAGRDGDLD